jgi:hypothetical protein
MADQQAENNATNTDNSAIDRDTLLAELGQLPDDDALTVSRGEDPPDDGDDSKIVDDSGAEDDDTSKEDDESEGDEEESGEEPEDEGEESEDEDEDEDDEDAPEDEVADQRIAKIQAEEKRAKQAVSAERAALAEDRAQFVQEKAKWGERLEHFEKLAARASYDPAGVLSMLGLHEDDYESAARQLFALSPEGQKNPKLREEAVAAQRTRGNATKVEELTAKVAELEKAQSDRAKQEQESASRTHYLDAVTDAASKKTPIMRALIGSDPAEARELLWLAAQRYAAKHDVVPTAKELIRYAEKSEQQALEKRGFELVGTKSTKPKTKETTPAEKTTQAKPDTNGTNNKPPDDGTPKTPEQIDAELLGDDTVWT